MSGPEGIPLRAQQGPAPLEARAGLVSVAVSALRAAPRGAGEAFASFIGWLAWSLRIRRRIALDNLRVAFPAAPAAEHRRVARAAYDSMARAMYESLTSDLRSDEEVSRAVVVDDWKGLDQLLAARKPVLIASAHLGSWEYFAQAMSRRGAVFSAVVRPLAGAFNRWLFRNRERAGIELILQRGALRGMLKALRRGRAVVQLLDQALPGREAVWAPFFGRPASTTPALSLAALRTGAPVYVVAAVREGERLRMKVEGPIPFRPRGGLSRTAQVAAHVVELNAVLERLVRAHPEQWLWLHRRWKGAPPEAQIASRSSTPACTSGG
jgi:KDO2-lipid IV(A) lauroyltransferase